MYVVAFTKKKKKGKKEKKDHKMKNKIYHTVGTVPKFNRNRIV